MNKKKKLKENPFFVLENINQVWNENINEVWNENINEVWNEKLEEKFWEALMITKKSELGDDSKVEKVFNTPMYDKYSIVEFSLEETYRIFDLIEYGLNKCQELNEDLFYEIKDFVKIYHVYNYCYKILYT